MLESALKSGTRRVRRWLLPREVRKNHDYDEQTIEIMAQVLGESSNGIDVGAHRGSVLRHMLKLAPRGRHFAFEPIPALAAGLRASFEGVAVHEVALSDAAGTATFNHVLNYAGRSGLRRRSYPGAPVIDEITVRTARLDEVVPPDVPIAFVKIDVEGAELQVLRGSTSLLRRHRPIVVFEHGLGAADHYGTTPDQVFDVLAECGLDVSLMVDWLKGRNALTRDQFIAHGRGGPDWYFVAHAETRVLSAGQSRRASFSIRRRAPGPRSRSRLPEHLE